MNGICPNCEKVTALEELNREEEFIIRGESIKIDVHLYKCLECGEEFEEPGLPFDPIAEAYREYRHQKGMLQPEQIRDFRRKYGLTQSELSSLLSWGGATLSRYENDALQTEAHDQILKLVIHPGNFLQLLKSKPDMLAPKKRQELLDKLKIEAKSGYPLLEACEDVFGSYDPDIYSGYKSLDLAKFFNAILFFCSEDGIPKTKLNKLLFYADFMHFKDYSVSITGARYARLPFGPVPDNYNSFYATLIDERKAIRVEERPFIDYMGEFFVAQMKPDLSIFTTSELKVLATVKEFFASYNATKISEQSHQEKGYLEIENAHLIPYSFAEQMNIG
jgi:putative zinc finger/helix-turn-helix YgiT family protein